MFKEKKMKEAVRWLFSLFEISDFDDYDEEVYGEDFGLCYGIEEQCPDCQRI